MPKKTRSTQSQEEALAWFSAFHDQKKRLPTTREIEALRGPYVKRVRRLGGLAGISGSLGVEPDKFPKKCAYEDHEIIKFLREWIKSLDSEDLPDPPTKAQVDEAFRTGKLRVSYDRLCDRLGGTWEDALTTTGFYRFSFQATDCVRLAAKALPHLLDSSRSGKQAAIATVARRGFTPMLGDIRRLYPDITSLFRYRASWNDWLSPQPRVAERTQQSIRSLALLALIPDHGDVTNFENRIQEIQQDGRGPAFSSRLFASLQPDHLPSAMAYGRAVDSFQRDYGVLREERFAKGWEISHLVSSQVVDPIFMPEIRQAFASI